MCSCLSCMLYALNFSPVAFVPLPLTSPSPCLLMRATVNKQVVAMLVEEPAIGPSQNECGASQLELLGVPEFSTAHTTQT